MISHLGITCTVDLKIAATKSVISCKAVIFISPKYFDPSLFVCSIIKNIQMKLVKKNEWSQNRRVVKKFSMLTKKIFEMGHSHISHALAAVQLKGKDVYPRSTLGWSRVLQGAKRIKLNNKQILKERYCPVRGRQHHRWPRYEQRSGGRQQSQRTIYRSMPAKTKELIAKTHNPVDISGATENILTGDINQLALEQLI